MGNTRKRAVVTGLVLLALFLASFAIAPPVSAAVLPDLILNVTKTQAETGPVIPPQTFTVKIHLAPAPGSNVYFTIWGRVTGPAPPKPNYIGGTGILEGNVLTMNLTTTHLHTGTGAWRDTGVMQVKYNVVSNSGTWYEIGHDFQPTTKLFDVERYSAGTMVKAP